MEMSGMQAGAARAADSRPLNPMQRSMALASMRSPHAGLYIVQDVCELEAGIDEARLKDAWARVARRHGALRTRIEESGAGEFRQRVEAAPEFEWRSEDWSGVEERQVSAALEAWLAEDRRRGFRWADGVPMRFAHFRLAGGRAIVVWSVHHAILDGRSMTLAWQEWLAEYEGRTQKSENEKPWTGDAVPDGAAEYWRQYLEGSGEAARQITDRLTGTRAGGEAGAGRASASLSEEATEELHERARANGYTAHTLVQGAWALLMSRYEGAGDVLFGVTRTGRRSGSTAPGMMIRTLPLRVRVDEDRPAAAWLQELRREWLRQRQFEAAPLEDVCRWAGLPAAAAPFETWLVYDHASPLETLRKMDPAWNARKLRRVQKTEAPLTVTVYGAPALTVEIIYDRQRYCEETGRGLSRHLLELIRNLTEHPDAPVWKLEMLGREERRWLIEDVNRTPAPPAERVQVHRLIEAQAERRPEAVAIEWDGGRVTYGELDRWADSIVRRLGDAGAEPNEIVGVRAQSLAGTAAAMLGVLKSGAAFLVLPQDLPEERLALMLETAGMKRVIACGGNTDWMAARGLAVIDGTPDPRTVSGRRLESAGLDDAAYAVFTSGSTGRPKAVVVAHRGLANYVTAAVQKYGLSESDRRLQFVHAGSDAFIAEVFCCLGAGATLVEWPDGAGKTVGEYARVVRRRRITVTSMPARWAGEWAAALEAGGELPRDLRAVIVGMEKVQPASFGVWERLAQGGLRWFNVYGPSETSGVATVYEAGGSEWKEAGHVPIGKPIPNVRAYVLDERGRPVPAGVAGELYIGGEGVGLGYLGGGADDEARFLPDPFASGGSGRMYRTGDVAFRLPDGNLVFLGRKDHQVKIRGFRVELEEIEAALAGHPSVAHCAVSLMGAEGRERLAAYVELREGAAAAPEEWRAHLRRRLPEPMIPAVFVTMDRLPRTASGKIDRRALPEAAQEIERSAADAAGESAVENRLGELWAEALGIRRAGPEDDFFALGGDSLAATRLLMLVARESGAELSLGDLLRAPTPARLAALLEGIGKHPAAETGRSDFVLARAEGSRAPLILVATAVEFAWRMAKLAELLDAEQPTYVLAAVEEDAGRKGMAERLAPRVAEAVMRVTGGGPCVLGGYCLGGLVAYHAAQLLRAQGCDVRLVALLDTPAPGYPKVLREGPKYARQAREWLSGRAEYTLRDIGGHLRALWGVARKRAEERTPARAPFPVLQVMAGCDEVSQRVWEDPRLGWRELSEGGFESARVDAKHEGLLDAGALPQVAAVLNRALMRAGGGLVRGATTER